MSSMSSMRQNIDKTESLLRTSIGRRFLYPMLHQTPTSPSIELEICSQILLFLSRIPLIHNLLNRFLELRPSNKRELLAADVFWSSTSSWKGFKNLTWNVGWIFNLLDNFNLYATSPDLSINSNGPSYSEIRQRWIVLLLIFFLIWGVSFINTLSPTWNSKAR